MSKLFQLLAAEEERKRSAVEILNESFHTFKTKAGHFEGLIRTYTKRTEDGQDYAQERKVMITTVVERLKYTVQHWLKYTNVVLQREETNSSGVVKAEVVLNGKSFGEFSGTALLAMEKNLTQFILMLRAIPTLDPSVEWEVNSNEESQYTAKYPEVVKKTAKLQEPIVLYPATDKHPAQVQMATYDKVVGEWSAIRSSGKITSKEKAGILGRAEDLFIVIKQARIKANECSVVPITGDKFFNYILKGTV